MTYCYGFKYLNSVYLYADSATTSNEAPAGAPAETSFGVKHIRTKDKAVTESIIKIRKISERCYVALAGDVFRALDIIDVLIDQHRENQDFQKTINFVNMSFDADKHKSQSVALLIAYSSDKGSYLYRWDSVNRKLEAIDDYCGIGSLSKKNEEKIHGFVKFIKNQQTTKNAVLIGIAAFYQSLGLKQELLEEHVGGTITGLEVGKDGTNWLGETAYVIFDEDAQYQKSVIVVNYGGGFATLEVFAKRIKYYLTAYKVEDCIPWLKEWKSKIDQVLTSLSARNWVFINPKKNIFIVIQTENLTAYTSVSEIWYENKIEQTSFHPALLYVLKESDDNSFMDYYDEEAENRLIKRYQEIRFDKCI